MTGMTSLMECEQTSNTEGRCVQSGGWEEVGGGSSGRRSVNSGRRGRVRSRLTVHLANAVNDRQAELRAECVRHRVT